MKISYNWLKDYLHLSEDPRRLADQLSLVGLEVEEVIEKRLDFENVVVGKVIDVKLHPNADKLRLCQVDTGTQQLSIVCGAPNVAEGQTVPVAKVGAELPIGLKIKKAKIRGESSEGMICSEAELGLADHSDGIWELPESLPLGVPLHEALNFEADFIYDIAVTPNRPDCLSHIGVAREVGAIVGRHLHKPDVTFRENDAKAVDQVKIRIENPAGCPRYSARVIRNVKVGESPAWMVRRLEAVGMRSINNIVDITNYVLMETGHPLHAFDFDNISGQEVIVRDSSEGEKFVTLDDKEHTLKAGTVLICDGEKPVALGGIMGGLNSEVSQETVNILLESAYFNPLSIQNSARYLGIASEASQRFARGADPNGTTYALERAAKLMMELAGGDICQGIVDVYPEPVSSWEVALDTARINTLLGTRLSSGEMGTILEGIDLQVADGQVLIPTYRPDLTRVADIAEEISRLYGLDKIPAREKFEINYDMRKNFLDEFVDSLKNLMTGMGLQEVITPSMINSSLWEKVTGEPVYPILNPISRDMDGMRNSLIPSLLNVIKYNQNRQSKNLRIFEINRVFKAPQKAGDLPQEELRLGIALTGLRDGELWYSSRQNTDFYDIKGSVELLLDKINLDNWKFIYYSDFAIEDKGLAVSLDKDVVGGLGRLRRDVAAAFDLEEEIFVAELKVASLFQYATKENRYRQIPKFPAAERDLAFLVSEEVEAENLVKVIRENGGKYLKQVDVFDLYRGKQIPDGMKSIAFHLTFQSPERTLTEEEVNQKFEAVIGAVVKSFDAKLRDK